MHPMRLWHLPVWLLLAAGLSGADCSFYRPTGVVLYREPTALHGYHEGCLKAENPTGAEVLLYEPGERMPPPAERRANLPIAGGPWSFVSLQVGVTYRVVIQCSGYTWQLRTEFEMATPLGIGPPIQQAVIPAYSYEGGTVEVVGAGMVGPYTITAINARSGKRITIQNADISQQKANRIRFRLPTDMNINKDQANTRWFLQVAVGNNQDSRSEVLFIRDRSFGSGSRNATERPYISSVLWRPSVISGVANTIGAQDPLIVELFKGETQWTESTMCASSWTNGLVDIAAETEPTFVPFDPVNDDSSSAPWDPDYNRMIERASGDYATLCSDAWGAGGHNLLGLAELDRYGANRVTLFSSSLADFDAAPEYSTDLQVLTTGIATDGRPVCETRVKALLVCRDSSICGGVTGGWKTTWQPTDCAAKWPVGAGFADDRRSVTVHWVHAIRRNGLEVDYEAEGRAIPYPTRNMIVITDSPGRGQRVLPGDNRDHYSPAWCTRWVPGRSQEMRQAIGWWGGSENEATHTNPSTLVAAVTKVLSPSSTQAPNAPFVLAPVPWLQRGYALWAGHPSHTTAGACAEIQAHPATHN